jgi:hypothetical protein
MFLPLTMSGRCFFSLSAEKLNAPKFSCQLEKKDEKVVDCNNLLRESTSLLAGKTIEKRLLLYHHT